MLLGRGQLNNRVKMGFWLTKYSMSRNVEVPFLGRVRENGLVCHPLSHHSCHIQYSDVLSIRSTRYSSTISSTCTCVLVLVLVRYTCLVSMHNHAHAHVHTPSTFIQYVICAYTI